MSNRVPVDTRTIKVGDRIVYRDTDKYGHTMKVWRISPPGEGATAMSAGPHIWAHIREGSFSTVFDTQSYGYTKVEMPGSSCPRCGSPEPEHANFIEVYGDTHAKCRDLFHIVDEDDQ